MRPDKLEGKHTHLLWLLLAVSRNQAAERWCGSSGSIGLTLCL